MKRIRSLAVQVDLGTFPGLLGRGLIEARQMVCEQLGDVGPSPVYWAGASLKHVHIVEHVGQRDALPRSTGPGPH